MDKAIKEYRKRREHRMRLRGLRIDADDDNNNQNNGGGKSGGHGNTKLPYGLCMRYGIDIGEGWTPKDCWDALAKKGVSADEEYRKLKETGKAGGGEVETVEPKEPEKPKVERDWDTYNRVRLVISRSWDGKPLYEVRWKGKSGDVLWKRESFYTPEEAMAFLEDRGIEEIESDEHHTSYEDLKKRIEDRKIIKKATIGGEDTTVKGWIECGGRYRSGANVVLSWEDENGVSHEKSMNVFMLRDLAKEYGLNVLTRKGLLTAEEYEKQFHDASADGYDGMSITRTRDGDYVVSGMKDGERQTVTRLASEDDIQYYLREKGIDDITYIDEGGVGERVVDKEREMPTGLKKVGGKYLSGVKIGFSGGVFKLFGKTISGEKVDVATSWKWEILKYDVDEMGIGDVPLTGGAKKELRSLEEAFEKAKEVGFVDDGKGGISGARLGKGYLDTYVIFGRGKYGDSKEIDLETSDYGEAIEKLKSMGAEKIMDRSRTTIDLKDYKVPETVFEYDGEKYSEVGIKTDAYDGLKVYAKEADGDVKIMATLDSIGLMGGLREKIKGLGIDEGILKIDDAASEKIKGIEEFESKAIRVKGRGKMVPLRLEEEDGWDGKSYAFIGKDLDGTERPIAREDSMASLMKRIKEKGIDDEVVEKTDKSEEFKKAYEDMLKTRADFDKEAVTYGGRRFSKLKLHYYWGDFYIRGFDEFGDEVIADSGSLDDLGDRLKVYGLPDIKRLPKTDEGAKGYAQVLADREKIEKRKARRKELLDSGEYYACGEEMSCYKDIKIVPKGRGFIAKGMGMEDEEVPIKDFDGLDDAVTTLEDWGIEKYEIPYDGKMYSRPTYGMHHCYVEEQDDGSYKVYADTKRFGIKQVMFSGTEEKCREYLRDNGVCEKAVKTFKPLSCDKISVDRSASQKYSSLKNFDAYRREHIGDTFLKDVDYEDKELALELMREVLSMGAYKTVRSSKSFAGIIENGYLSQVEVGHGGAGACQNPEKRKKASKKFFGHEGSLDEHDYEKCGYVGYDDDAVDFDDFGHPFYGGSDGVNYTFKKDTMKDRTTYTFGDSLNTMHEMSSAGYDGETPSLEGFSSLGWDGRFEAVLDAYRDYKEGKIDYNEMFAKIRTEANNDYIELQYHGDVTVDDIEKISFQSQGGLWKTFNKMSEEKRKKIYSTLKEKGVKLYYKDGSKMEDGFEYILKEFPDLEKDAA